MGRTEKTETGIKNRCMLNKEPFKSSIPIIDSALSEDFGCHGKDVSGDLTTELSLIFDQEVNATVISRSSGILAGVPVSMLVFSRVDPNLKLVPFVKDGSSVEPNDKIIEIIGSAASIILAERTALNFLQHLSGIATKTNKFVMEIRDYPTVILDTRKTTPGLRSLEKYAVSMGGGQNHRFGLSDGILIKDNHIKVAGYGSKGLSDVIEDVQNRKKTFVDRADRSYQNANLKVEVEVEDIEQVKIALDAGADVLLLDNMSVEKMFEAVKMARGRAFTEASGGIELDNVKSVAETGVDFISVGALTHSAPALDMSLDLTGPVK